MSSLDGKGDYCLGGTGHQEQEERKGKEQQSGSGQQQQANVVGEYGDGLGGHSSSGCERLINQNTSTLPDDLNSNVQIITCHGFEIEVSPSQRKYLGASAKAKPGEQEPGLNCELYCGRLPKDVLEHEIIPVFEKYGEIWDLRLLMNATSYKNRGYAFIKYMNPESTKKAMTELNNYVVRPGTKGIQLEYCKPRVRLFVGNIPKAKSKEELYTEFARRTRGLKDVIIYKAPEDKKKNRGFCFLEYDNHTNAFSAKKLLGIPFAKVWGCEIIVDWADPIEEPEDDVMEQVKVLYVRNLTSRVHEDTLRELFSKHGTVERVKRIKDFAFVHFDQRENAEQALQELNNFEFHGAMMEVTWAKPPVDNQKKEEVLRARERRMTEMQRVQNSQSVFLCPPVPPYLRVPSAVPVYVDHPYEYEEIPYDYEYDHAYYPHLNPGRYATNEDIAYYNNENINTMHSLVIDDMYVHGRQPFEHPIPARAGRSYGAIGLPPNPAVPISRTGFSRGQHQRRVSFPPGKDFVRSDLVEHDNNWRLKTGGVTIELENPRTAATSAARPVSTGTGTSRRSKSWRRRT